MKGKYKNDYSIDWKLWKRNGGLREIPKSTIGELREFRPGVAERLWAFHFIWRLAELGLFYILTFHDIW
jgi:hypothetical protein